MRFRVDAASRVPIFQQIVDQVKQGVASGALREGDQLPPVRDLAMTLLINPNTVQKAYVELTHAGILAARKGLGVFVQPVKSRLDRRERAERLAEAADAFITEGLLLGYSPEALRDAVGERLERFDRGGEDG
jgi:GntR family transcriptional regulator